MTPNIMQHPPHGSNMPRQVASWGAVCAMSLGAFALVSSEFMPVSLLTPIAKDLAVTEGQAGLAITVAAAFALITSLFISSASGRIDRKKLLLFLMLLMIVSVAIVAFAPNYATFMVGRIFIGMAIGGFWSMSAATIIRLVPEDKVSKALAILNAGNALATVIAAPLGSFLGSLIGWRWAFFSLVPVAVVALLWKLFTLPSLPSEQSHANANTGNILTLLNQSHIALGMAAVSLFFMGQFALYTYLRPFLETVTKVSPSTLSLMLFILGTSGFLGTLFIGTLLKDNLYRTLITIPFLMAMIAVALILLGDSFIITAMLLSLWGFVATSAPVGWWTWLARNLPNDTERGGGLMVAVVQLAIALGATLGGSLFDNFGYRATFGMSAVILVMAAVLAILAARVVRGKRT